MSGELRIGLVGCGRLAELGYLPALRRAAGARLVAVADPDAGRRTAVARASAVTGYEDGAAMVAAGGLDAVIVASPAAAHVGDARAAAQAGLPALVEKPPAPDVAGARSLAALDPAPRIGFNRRFEPGLAALRAALAGGGPVQLHLELCYRRASWRPHAVADDALLDLGPHLVDLATWLTRGPVRAAHARELTPTTARFELELERGRATIECATDRPHRERVEARDDGGRRVGGVRRGGLLAGLAARVRGGGHPLADSLTAQVEAFAAAVAGTGGDESPLGTAEQAVAVMAVVDAVREDAAAAGRPAVPTPAAV